jgi:hypothetical protein
LRNDPSLYYNEIIGGTNNAATIVGFMLYPHKELLRIIYFWMLAALAHIVLSIV